MTADDQDLAAYVLLRTDLPSMNPGKGAAQVHHAGVQMIAKYASSDMVQAYINSGNAAGAAYFNTTIVLGAAKHEIMNVLSAAENLANYSPNTVMFGSVTDPSYPFFVENIEIANLIPTTATTYQVNRQADGRVLMVREEFTCAWFLGSRNNILFRDLFADLRLHP